MNWNDRIRQALAARGHTPDDEILDELAQHARSMYDAARADGASAVEAETRLEQQTVRAGPTCARAA